MGVGAPADLGLGALKGDYLVGLIRDYQRRRAAGLDGVAMRCHRPDVVGVRVCNPAVIGCESEGHAADKAG